MIKVTEEMKTRIKNEYHYSDSKVLANELGISYHTVMKWAQKLGLKKSADYVPPTTLDTNSQKLIKEHYPKGDLEWLSYKLDKSIHAITEWARKRGIKREVQSNRNGTLEPLFNKTIQSYYWLGFIAADGYISKDGHFMLSQSEKDKELVYRLADFLNTSVYEFYPSSGYNRNRAKSYRVNVCDKTLGPEINKMFGLQKGQKKTYTPLNLDFIKTENQAMAFLCGFIDGDGSLRTGGQYKIQVHKSQQKTFENLLMRLTNFHHSSKLEHRTDRKEPSFGFYVKIKSARRLREFAKLYGIGSSRKFTL